MLIERVLSVYHGYYAYFDDNPEFYEWMKNIRLKHKWCEEHSYNRLIFLTDYRDRTIDFNLLKRIEADVKAYCKYLQKAKKTDVKVEKFYIDTEKIPFRFLVKLTNEEIMRGIILPMRMKL